MTLKFRIIWASVCILSIPLLIYLIYPSEWRQTIPWLIGAGGLYTTYELILWIKKK